MAERKFLFVSLDGLIGDTAWTVAKEGNAVRYFIGNQEEREIADGFDCAMRVMPVISTSTASSTPTGFIRSSSRPGSAIRPSAFNRKAC